MSSKSSNTIKYLVVSLLIAGAGLVRAESAGNIIRLVGTVSAVDAAGASRPLTAGDAVNVGDTIGTGEKSAVQIQMKDAAVVALSGPSALKIQSYTFQKGANAPDKVLMTLQKGRFRTITGNAKKSGYTMKSPIATVSIQGTAFDMLMYPGDPVTTTVILREGGVLVQGERVSRSLDVPGDSITIGKKQPKDDVSDLDAILPLKRTGSFTPPLTPPPSDTSGNASP